MYERDPASMFVAIFSRKLLCSFLWNEEPRGKRGRYMHASNTEGWDHGLLYSIKSIDEIVASLNGWDAQIVHEWLLLFMT